MYYLYTLVAIYHAVQTLPIRLNCISMMGGSMSTIESDFSETRG